MKILYLNCSMGASGDMLAAALTELLPDPEEFLAEINSLKIPGVKIEMEPAVKCGIAGTHITVSVEGKQENEALSGHSHEDDHIHPHEREHNNPYYHEHNHLNPNNLENNNFLSSEFNDNPIQIHTHHHSGMTEISHIVNDFNLPENVKQDILTVFGLIAEAESAVHGTPVPEIHFHEVGTMDAIVDVTAVCMLMNKIAADEVIVSPIHVGSGQVRCAHGILPVPAPATAYILKNIPIYGGKIDGELCTPTGAALLRHFATKFGDMPVMKTNAIGYGMGTKDFEAANCLRAMLGETVKTGKTKTTGCSRTLPGEVCEAENRSNIVLELSCNVDDMTAEAIGFAMKRLLEGGALEVYTVPIVMKKSRPGTLIRVMCQEDKREEMITLLFLHTTTIGIRETITHRYILKREIETFNTPYGSVRRKNSTGYNITRSKWEYDDLARIAKEKNTSFENARQLVEESIESQSDKSD